jgi:hypothetical protein
MPSANINGTPIPTQLITLLVTGINQQLDLRNLENRGITARVLNLEINAEGLILTSFVRILPDAQLDF